MADPRVHPTSSSADTPPPPSSSIPSSKPNPSQPTTYVVQFPREQIFRYPPPENARKFETLSRGTGGRNCCRRCCYFTFCILAFLIIAAGISAGVMYLVFRFKSPEYRIIDFQIREIELTSVTPISPRFDVTVRAENPNEKMGIYYEDNSAVEVFYKDVKLSEGVLPAFYQPKRNTTVIECSLNGSDVLLSTAVKTELRNALYRRSVPFVVKVWAPVSLKVGKAKTWVINVKVNCDVELDGLNEGANVVSSKCDYSAGLW